MKSNRKQLNQRLLDCVITRDVNQVKLLLEQGADVNARDSEHDETPLILAAKHADAAMIESLLKVGAEMDARDDKGRTALFYAPVLSDKFDSLLSAGADPQVKDNTGNSILMHIVSESTSLAEVNRLLSLGIDSRCQNEDEETAADLAEQLGLLKVVERLRSAQL